LVTVPRRPSEVNGTPLAPETSAAPAA